MSTPRDAAREAKAKRAEGAPAGETLDQAIESMRSEIQLLREQNVQISEALAEVLDSVGARLDILDRKVSTNERMISTKTIETLTRAQVARIMRDEAKVQGP